MADEAERKRIFFDELYASDSEPDEEHGEEFESVRDFLQKSTRPSHLVPETSSSSSSGVVQEVRTPLIPIKAPALVRSISAPTSSARKATSSSVVKETPLPLPRQRLVGQKGTPLAKEVSFVEETPLVARSGEPMRRFSSPAEVKKPVGKLTGNSSTLGKRKRDSLVMVPESRRIFNGQKFFYLPNDDVAPARKARIRKAQEYGALWMRVYDEDVTHVIVDKSLTYDDIQKFLNLKAPPNAMMVNEDYPIDCIMLQIRLDHTKKQYLVSGYPLAQAVDIPLEKPLPQLTTEDPAESLQLKPPASKPERGISFPPKTTPSPSPSSNQGTLEENSVSVVKHGDILDEIIQETKKLEHFLPGLEDEDVLSTAASQELDDNNGYSSPQEKPKASHKKKSSSSIPWQENFSCMKGGTGESTVENPNAATINILQEMANYYDRMNDSWRLIAYRRAITSLKRQTTKITTYDEAYSLPFIGHRLAEKIEEIVRTNRLRRLDNTKLEPTDHVLQQFMNIYGVGYGHASKWLAQGHRTFSDLLEKANLTESQKIGIERYDDFLTRIPRDEVAALGEIIKETARGIDPEVNIIIGGSYRRGAKDSGDIDLLVTKPGTDIAELQPFFTELVEVLEKKSFLVAALAVFHSEGNKWHGCCVLPGQEKPIWRRIDFLLVADCELGAALIYFTGNDIFNRSIRLLASKKNMRLNQRGLYKDVMRGPGRVKLTDGVLVEGKDEKRIFEILGVPWRKPEDRIC